ncbi:hypothetical protein FNV43_RR18394 [Rhamnella rubrinervis]|uniref:Uncharacterized protein n=1 Tax=Rhamnella rubrinervis TaxID=2594499 RepID=A0A8K0E4H3_9ROSA|nr:hypothetical protein FNV43_RR18394 [Rhamnella rubrinervis]
MFVLLLGGSGWPWISSSLACPYLGRIRSSERVGTAQKPNATFENMVLLFKVRFHCSKVSSAACRCVEVEGVFGKYRQKAFGFSLEECPDHVLLFGGDPEPFAEIRGCTSAKSVRSCIVTGKVLQVSPAVRHKLPWHDTVEVQHHVNDAVEGESEPYFEGDLVCASTRRKELPLRVRADNLIGSACRTSPKSGPIAAWTVYPNARGWIGVSTLGTVLGLENHDREVLVDGKRRGESKVEVAQEFSNKGSEDETRVGDKKGFRLTVVSMKGCDRVLDLNERL